MVELRKRKAAPPAPEPPAKKKAAAKAKASATKQDDAPAKAGDAGAKPAAANGTAPPKVGDTIALDGFGGTVETHDGRAVSLTELVEESDGGVVLFTYPKANTPGCKFP
jgi:thioredoxin-dependent peroxiredoxin